MKNEDFTIQKFNELKTYTKLKTIGKPNRKQYIYKYMNAERALEFISKKELCFVEPSLWVDPYERRFYDADYSNFKNFQKPLKIYSTCTTFNQKSEAAWKVYNYDNKGLASRCVLFKIKRNIFLDRLSKYALKNDLDLYEGKANYFFNDYTINKLHLKDQKFYKEFFNDFNLEKYLNLLLIKRKAFEYENELRYFFIKNQKSEKDKIFIPLYNLDLIESIWYDNNCSEYEINLIKDICNTNNINDNIKKFDLYEYDKNTKIKIDSPF